MPTKHQSVARYVIDKHLISSERSEVKHGAFIPRPGKDGRLETSVVGIDGLNNSNIWSLGDHYILQNIKPKGRKIKGRADIASKDIIKNGLDLHDDTMWEGRHSNIISWPSEEEDRLQKATELVQASKFIKYPE